MDEGIPRDPLAFNGKTVLVVGGSSGIGNGVAQAFRYCGASVHVWGTKPTAGDYSDIAGSNLDGLTYSKVDVSRADDIAEAEPPFERLDVLVLSQGAVLYGRGEFSPDGFAQVIAINLSSVMSCAVKFQQQLAEARGAVIVISSTAAFRSTKGNPGYAASKAGTLGLVRSLAEAWGETGIRVNGIAPGLIATKMTKVTTEHPERLGKMLDRIPVHRLGEPSDVAGAALFLASPLSKYVVGHTIVVDGGLILA